MIDYEHVLNPPQLEAIMTREGPVLVIAGAGSGKTRTLVYRVARLVETDVPPESILLLTFTRKAAQEMLERAASLSDPRCRLVSGGTFHSLANRVLRSHAHLLGFINSFTILDRSDMEEVITSLIPELGMPKGTPRFPKRATLANILSKAANLQRPINECVTEEYGQFLQFISQINTLGRLYADYKKVHQLMDYDDLILNFQKLLKEHDDVRKDLNRQYRYVMVDEYQDTNAIQADIVRWLAHEHQNVMVVGDDSQSIYSFRGANYRNMFEFPKQFVDVRIIKLEENYRSTQPILKLANALMEQADQRYTKCLFTQRKGGKQPRVVDTRTEPEQAMFICRYIKEQIQHGRSISNFAILFRAGYHAFELEAELIRQGIRYMKYGGFKFLESAHIKDFLAHLRVAVNVNDTLSWERVLRLIRNVGYSKSRAIIQWMKADRIPPQRLHEWPGASKKESGLKVLSEFLARFASKKMKPEEAVEEVMEYYIPILQDKFDDYPRRQKDLEQLITMASRYKKIRSLLDDLVLEPPTSPADITVGEKIESLTLSTIHSAKGLEWPEVLIIWLMEGRFPPSRAYNNPADLEEERRLMYVAATRAKDQLIMCYPGKESAPPWSSWEGSGAVNRNGPSSFIRDLPEDIISYESTGMERRSSRRNWGDTSAVSYRPGQEVSSDLSQGDRVRHPAFGAGVVSRLFGNDKVEVLFRDAGRKLLHLEYTTLDKI